MAPVFSVEGHYSKRHILRLTPLFHLIYISKLVGLTFEVHDNENSKECSRDVNRNEEERKTIRLGNGHNKVSPSCLDIFCYSYCFLGLFTGDITSSCMKPQMKNVCYFCNQCRIIKHLLWNNMVRTKIFMEQSVPYSLSTISPNI